MVINTNTKIFLNKLLALNSTGLEQDWDVELANKDRITEFIAIFHNNVLTLPERHALVSLIIASYDDYLNYVGNVEIQNKIWDKIKTILDMNKGDYNDILAYWALSTKKDIFKATPAIRDYLKYI